MTQAVRVVARISWTRLRRGRTLWMTALLGTIPLLAAAWQRAFEPDPAARWETIAQLMLRIFVTLAAALHLASAVGEEIEGRTYTYLWSRPMPRAALLLGKLLAALPALVVASWTAMAGAFFVAVGAPGMETAGWLLRGLAAAALAGMGAGVFAAGVGAIATRHPFVFVLGYFLLAEQLLPFVPTVANLSFLHHAFVVAGVERRIPGEVPFSVGALLVLTAVWLGVGVWRVTVAEYGRADA